MKQCKFITSQGRCEQHVEQRAIPGTCRLERVELEGPCGGGGEEHLLAVSDCESDPSGLCYYHKKLVEGLLCDHEGRQGYSRCI